MFKKILIANRGEIAVRIMATCREMGIAPVAVYSEADRLARHVREADEAIEIGPAPASQSYLSIPKVVQAALASGAQALHPGYGFLAENADFAEACAKAGLVFIGPPPAAMRLMGSKIAAKRLALEVGAPIVPGYDGSAQDDETLLREAQRVGFPLLIKASAGGGGKGMRSVSSPEDFLAQLAGARREALAAFGDETVFLESLIDRPRHVEIQILADQHGKLVHLGERECSLQRRHQKIVEESPSPALTPALRARMGAAAVAIARAAGYVNAGTIEFILAQDQQFYFLEMNTRLQVEHPVTELVTGLDLVRQQINIAAGLPLELTQEEITPRGHAIEVRLYAEDPAQNFLPSTGRVTLCSFPASPGVRVDSGIESNDEISQFYDPMIAKLIVSAEDRASAIERLHTALQRSAILGVTTNMPLLLSISSHPAFAAGNTHTGFLVEYGLLSREQAQELPESVLFAAALCDLHGETLTRPFVPSRNGMPSPWQTLGNWRVAGEARILSYTFQAEEYRVAAVPSIEQEATWLMHINGSATEEVVCTFGENSLLILSWGKRRERIYAQTLQDETQVSLSGITYRLRRRRPPDVTTASRGSEGAHAQKTLQAPMAGTVVKVEVQAGDRVEAHQPLVILSAMKMEHVISAPYAGAILRVNFGEGEVVAGGAVMVEME